MKEYGPAFILMAISVTAALAVIAIRMGQVALALEALAP